MGRVEREHTLQTENGVQEQSGDKPETEHGQRVGLPGPAGLGVGTGDPVDEALDGEKRRSPGARPPRKVAAR